MADVPQFPFTLPAKVERAILAFAKVWADDEATEARIDAAGIALRAAIFAYANAPTPASRGPACPTCGSQWPDLFKSGDCFGPVMGRCHNPFHAAPRGPACPDTKEV